MAEKKYPLSCSNDNLTYMAFNILKALFNEDTDDGSTLDGIADALVFLLGKTDAEELAFLINQRLEVKDE